MMSPIFFGFFGFFGFLVTLALLAIGIAAVRRGTLTFATVVHTYTAFVLGLSIVLALSGGALLLKSILSTVIARDFSYQTADYPRPLPPPGVAGVAERAQTQADDDLSAGITLLVIGVGLGAAHAYGNAVAARRDASAAGTVARGFDVAMLTVGAIVGLVSGAILLNALLRRYVVTAAPATPFMQPRPGGALGYTAMFVPLWAYFARRVWRALRTSPAPTACAAASSVESEPPPRL